MNYQGRVISGGTAFNGTGQFKFAIVSSDGYTFHWKNDGTTTAEAPATAVSLPVNKGLFSVQLGDSAIANMGTINSAALSNTGLKLRVWFNDGVKGWQTFKPDQALNEGALASVLPVPAVVIDVNSWDSFFGGNFRWAKGCYIRKTMGKLRVLGKMTVFYSFNDGSATTEYPVAKVKCSTVVSDLSGRHRSVKNFEFLINEPKPDGTRASESTPVDFGVDMESMAQGLSMFEFHIDFIEKNGVPLNPTDEFYSQKLMVLGNVLLLEL